MLCQNYYVSPFFRKELISCSSFGPEGSGFPLFLILIVFAGLLARQRKGELKRLNEQLLQINAALKRQAKIESYAPSLSYAPAGARIPESEVIVDPRKEQLLSCLRSGKSFLRNQGPKQAFSEFKKALDLAKDLKDSIEEKKAARGLGAQYLIHIHYFT